MYSTYNTYAYMRMRVFLYVTCILKVEKYVHHFH